MIQNSTKTEEEELEKEGIGHPYLQPYLHLSISTLPTNPPYLANAYIVPSELLDDIEY